MKRLISNGLFSLLISIMLLAFHATATAATFCEDGYIYRDYCLDNPIASECTPDPITQPDNFYECRTDYQAGRGNHFLRIEDCDPS